MVKLRKSAGKNYVGEEPGMEQLILHFIPPISAAIVGDTNHYDRVLETFSKPLMKMITQYTVNLLRN